MREQEKNLKVHSGLAWFVITSLLFAASVAAFVFGVIYGILPLIIGGSVVLVAWVVMLSGFFTLQPNEAAVIILFGAYKGTVKTSGWHWANPFYTKKKISLRQRNLNGEKLKVNDEMGNPIEKDGK